MRSTSRVVGCSINTVTKLLEDAGRACIIFHDTAIRSVKARSVQCDEMWSFLYAKKKNVAGALNAPESAGDVWTWVAIDRDSKLIISWYVGDRGQDAANIFIHDLRGRLDGPTEIVTDAHAPYVKAIRRWFTDRQAYAQETKGGRRRISGLPDMERSTTSHVERHNLTMRMSMKRFARRANSFSKKLQNHKYALALYFVWYNFCRPHSTLGTTPAVAAGLVDKKYEMRHIIDMADGMIPKRLVAKT